MKLLLDEHIDKLVAEQLRARGFDVVAVTEDQTLVRSEDPALLRQGFADHRAIVTYDVAGFRVGVNERHVNEEGHFGVIFLSSRRFPQGKHHVGALVTALEKLLAEMSAAAALADREMWL